MNKTADISKKILKTIESSNSVLLHIHKYPDLDSICSCIALASYLKNLGKNVTVLSGETNIKSKYQILPGFNMITDSTLDKVKLNTFDLFIMTDCSSIDRVSQFINQQDLSQIKSVNIDHHPDNSIIANINFVHPNRSSTSELVFLLFKYWKHIPTYIEALNLLIGISDDTGNFKYPSTTYWKLFSIASKLSRIAPDHIGYLDKFQYSEPESLDFIRLALNNKKTYFNDQVLISSLDTNSLKKNKILDIHSRRSYVADLFRSTNQWKIIIILTAFEKDKTVAVFRTTGEPIYDVSSLAHKFEGGGHINASAATIKLPLTLAKRAILKEIKNLYDFSTEVK
jgi:bifunctional oligoribonuclease and PAP phosphatase NrnA